jgi:hypothetical protein
MGSGAANPHNEHVKSVRTFADYIATSHDVGLTLGGEPEVDLFGFSDAAYLTKDDSLSKLAYCFFLNLTSDRLKILPEAELKALDEAIRQAAWLRNFLEGLTYNQIKPKSSICVDSVEIQYRY